MNCWAIAAGSGVVLVDTGIHEPGSMDQLERALDQVNLKLEHVRLLVCTHAHADHYGQAATICERAGCELWMHPNHAHATKTLGDSEAALARMLEIGRQSGVSDAALQRYAEARQEAPPLIASAIEPHRNLVPGVEVDSDLGTWSVHETPGHAPSHVCLFQPERRLLLSGDHLLGRISLYYDFGWSPDPAGEFLHSLGVVEELDARLALAGHGRPFADVAAHIAGNRALLGERLQAVQDALAEPRTALEIVPAVYGEEVTAANAAWRLTETLCYLRHLELEERVALADEQQQRWRAR
jgi:glyoxylase-like metal-dependent hydrolase (beta-lactamase superfamily II)